MAQDLKESLQAARGLFQQVEISTQGGAPKPFSVKLNKVGISLGESRYDGIRFRTPSNPGDLAWIFFYPPDDAESAGFKSWYITTAQGPNSGGFRNFHLVKYDWLESAKGYDLLGEHSGIIQHLDAATLRPNTEYIMYFEFQNTAPVTMKGAITINNSGASVENNPLALAEKLGIVLKP